MTRILVDTSIWIDHLLASPLIRGDVRLWTRDRRRAEAAARLGIDAPP
ncbi:hypothetical protein GCM10025768_26490 [Microbacterium pseudoresistens]|uniref:Putative nucleic acid-binding protein n=1 Tax=Microbacterium pseudoresistens TaxID=640634 RepID=A0A7Y9ETN6_9MICO|nr:hypothetical protein [Microbacterium pseudoresistens]NYD53762.1 putative nucleic acid-binding protein [Microbacterium pseudoresistens]